MHPALSDTALLDRIDHLVRVTHAATAELLVHLGEVDRRRLYAQLGYASLFEWCTKRLGFSEDEAYKRIAVARAGRDFPVLIERIRDGKLHLSGAVQLVPKLSGEGATELLDAASGQSKRAIEKLLADRHPKPDAPSRMQKLPTKPEPPAAPGPAPQPERRAPPPEPLGAARYKVQFTADQALIDKLDEAKELLSHRIPDGDIGKVVDQALEILCEKLRKERFAELSREPEVPPTELAPGRVEKAARHIPHRVKRAVVERDGGQCAYVAPDGRRCQERRFIEFHHLEPWARNPVHSIEGIALRCRTHNQYQARLDFGEEVIEAHIAERGQRKLSSS